MIERVRPSASIEWDYGNDGRDGRYYIEYRSPKCNRRIRWYESDTACDQCGTFYDWGNREPSTEMFREEVVAVSDSMKQITTG